MPAALWTQTGQQTAPKANIIVCSITFIKKDLSLRHTYTLVINLECSLVFPITNFNVCQVWETLINIDTTKAEEIISIDVTKAEEVISIDVTKAEEVT